MTTSSLSETAPLARSSGPYWPYVASSDFLLAAWGVPTDRTPWFLVYDHGSLERTKIDSAPPPARGSVPVAFEVTTSPYALQQHIYYIAEGGRVSELVRNAASSGPTESPWIQGAVSNCPGAPLADTGSPLVGFGIHGSAEQRVYYASSDHTLRELRWNGYEWSQSAVTGPGSVAPGSGLTALKHGESAGETPNLHVYWLAAVGDQQHVMESMCSVFSGADGAWSQLDLTAATRTGAARPGTPLASIAMTGKNLVYYVADDGTIHQLAWTGEWQDTALPSVPLDRLTDLLAFQIVLGVVVYYVGLDQHVHELWCSDGVSWVESDITARAGAPAVSPGTSLKGRSDLAAQQNSQSVYYTAVDGQVHALTWNKDGKLTWRDSQETSTLSVTLSAKLLQNYLVGSLVDGGKDPVAVASAGGDIEMMAMDDGGNITSFYPDPTSDTGYRSTSTGLGGSVMAAAVAPTGQLVLLAGTDAGELNQVLQSSSSLAAWSEPQSIDYQPVGAGKMVIQSVFMTTASYGTPASLSLGACMTEQGGGGSVSYLYLWSWGGTPAVVGSVNREYPTNDLVWRWAAGGDGPVAVGAEVGGSKIYLADTASLRAIDSPAAVLDIATMPGSSVVYAVLADGTTRALDLRATPPAFQLVTDSQAFFGPSPQKIWAATQAETNHTHVLVLTTDNVLWHLAPSPGSPSPFLQPAPILPNVATCSVANDHVGFVHALAARTTLGSVTHLILPQRGQSWESSRLEVPKPEVRPYWSYSCDVTLLDSHDAPLSSTSVVLHASERTQLLINGLSYTLGPYQGAAVTTNTSGMVSVAYRADALAAPTLLVSVPSIMAPNESVAVNLHAGVVAKLQNLSGPDLAAARDTSGNPILQPQYQSSAQAVASAVSRSVDLGRNHLGAVRSAKYVHPTRSRPGVAYFDGDKASLRKIHFPLVRDAHWSLRFDEGGASFADLTAEEAEAQIREMKASLPAPSALPAWLVRLDDLVRGILKKIVKVVKFVVTRVGAAVSAVIHVVIEGVKHVFTAVIDTVRHALDLVESVFASVAIEFKKLAQWLGFIFDWQDILRTQAAIASAVDQGLGFLADYAAALRKQIDGQFATLEAAVSRQLTSWIDQLDPDKPSGGYIASHAQDNPTMSDSMSNNIVLNGFLDNASSATSPMARLLPMSAQLDGLHSRIEQLTGKVTSQQGSFDQLTGAFTTLGGARDNVLTGLLVSLLRVLQAVLEGVLSGMNDLIDAALDAAADLVQLLRSMLDEAWDIPLLSDLFSFVTNGTTLTAGNLLALILAIPVTVFHKLVHGVAPFPTDASVAEFQAEIAGAFRQSLPGSASSLASSTWGGAVSPKTASALSETACYAVIGGGLLGGWVDASKLLGGAPVQLINGLRLACRALGCVCSFPGFYKAVPSAPYLWTYDVFSFNMDLVFVASPDKLDPDVKAIMNTVLGALRIAVAAYQAHEDAHESALALAGDVIGSLPIALKFLGYSAIVEASEGLSLLGLGVADVVGALTAALIGHALREKLLSAAGA